MGMGMRMRMMKKMRMRIDDTGEDYLTRGIGRREMREGIYRGMASVPALLYVHSTRSTCACGSRADRKHHYHHCYYCTPCCISALLQQSCTVPPGVRSAQPACRCL